MKLLMILTTLWLSIVPAMYNDDKSIDQVKNAFEKCIRNNGACETYTFQALALVYPDAADFSYTDNHSFYQAVKAGDDWELVGAAYQQEVLKKAQEMANGGQPVVAVYLDQNEEPLHVAVILPGELQTSGSWNMQVPQAISLPDFNPDNAFIQKPLSYAFEKRALLSLKIFARK